MGPNIHFWQKKWASPISESGYPDPMFDAFPFFYSEDFETAKAMHDAFRLQLRLTQRVHFSERMVTRANVMETPMVGLYGYSYSHDVVLNAASENPDFWLSVRYDQALPSQSTICRAASPGDDDPMDLSGTSNMLGMRLDGGAVTSFIACYIGEPLLRPIRFEPDTVRPTAADAFVSARMIALSRAARPELTVLDEQKLMESTIEVLLLHRRHNYSAFIRKPTKRPTPRDVKRAVDYIHAYAETNPGLAKLAEIAEVPGRTLSAHFADFVGASPVAYVKRVRLQNARTALLNGEALSVASAARTQGFHHMGRFSADFTQAFHEPPRRTLGRSASR